MPASVSPALAITRLPPTRRFVSDRLNWNWSSRTAEPTTQTPASNEIPIRNPSGPLPKSNPDGIANHVSNAATPVACRINLITSPPFATLAQGISVNLLREPASPGAQSSKCDEQYRCCSEPRCSEPLVEFVDQTRSVSKHYRSVRKRPVYTKLQLARAESDRRQGSDQEVRRKYRKKQHYYWPGRTVRLFIELEFHRSNRPPSS